VHVKAQWKRPNPGTVEMSGFTGDLEKGMLGLMASVRGRVRRMPKAESDGLAPLLIGSMETLRLSLRVFVLQR
jgi:hypothetical protein